jgi:hypothetical protein
MKTAIITLFALLCILPVTIQANERYTLRDTQGRLQGSLVITGPKITVRDASGRVTGSAVVSGNRVTIRDNQGRLGGQLPGTGTRGAVSGKSGGAGASSVSGSRGTAKK